MYRIIVLNVLMLLTCSLFAQQKPVNSAEEFEKRYERRIQQDVLAGTYIPKDLTDVFMELNRLIDKPSKQKFKTASEEEVVHKLYFSLGRWMIVNWGFYGGSRLSVFLNKLGVHHPEEMAKFLIITYHRNLNKNKLDVKELVTSLQEARSQEAAERLEKGEVIKSETRKRTTPPKKD